jgi:hypothetical protein
MLFSVKKRTIFKRYFSWLFFIIYSILFLQFFTIMYGNQQLFVKFLNLIISEPRLILLFSFIILINSIGCFFGTQKAIKSLALEDQSLLYELFNKQKEKILYTDILSFSYTDDSFKNFEITLKNGEKKVIYPTIKKKEEAFKLIQQKILESQNKDK